MALTSPNYQCFHRAVLRIEKLHHYQVSQTNIVLDYTCLMHIEGRKAFRRLKVQMRVSMELIFYTFFVFLLQCLLLAHMLQQGTKAMR